MIHTNTTAATETPRTRPRAVHDRDMTDRDMDRPPSRCEQNPQPVRVRFSARRPQVIAATATGSRPRGRIQYELDMGLAERDYRRRPFDSNYGTIRAWSATTWLIAILIAVFIIDAILTPPPHLWGMLVSEAAVREIENEFASGEYVLRLMGPLARGMHFSSATVVDRAQLWRVATFPFIHVDAWPLL